MSRKKMGVKSSVAILFWAGLFLLTPFIIIFNLIFQKGANVEAENRQGKKMENIVYNELPIEAQKYSIIINELGRVFQDCKIVRLGEDRSLNNINLVKGNNIRFGRVLVSIRAGGTKYKFNSDELGLAVGFRDDDEIRERVNLVPLEFIQSEIDEKKIAWHYYRISSLEDVQKISKVRKNKNGI